MSLIHPTMGEVLDRLSILSMKIMEGRLRQPEAEIAHFEAERTELVDSLLRSFSPAAWDLFLWAVELGAINGRMWELNKQARHSHEITLKDIHLLNDRRAELILRIGGGKQEKVY